MQLRTPKVHLVSAPEWLNPPRSPRRRVDSVRIQERGYVCPSVSAWPAAPRFDHGADRTRPRPLARPSVPLTCQALRRRCVTCSLIVQRSGKFATAPQTRSRCLRELGGRAPPIPNERMVVVLPRRRDDVGSRPPARDRLKKRACAPGCFAASAELSRVSRGARFRSARRAEAIALQAAPQIGGPNSRISVEDESRMDRPKRCADAAARVAHACSSRRAPFELGISLIRVVPVLSM